MVPSTRRDARAARRDRSAAHRPKAGTALRPRGLRAATGAVHRGEAPRSMGVVVKSAMSVPRPLKRRQFLGFIGKEVGGDECRHVEGRGAEIFVGEVGLERQDG